MAFRDGPFNDRKASLGWLAGGATVAAALAAVVILIADKHNGASSDGAVRRGFDSVMAPANGVLEAPVRWAGDAVNYVGGYFFAVSENRHLHAQLRDMERWRDAAIALKNVNDRYEALLKLRTEPEFPMVTGRAVLDSRGPFANARLIDVGSDAGVKVGNPVLADHGLIGRVVGTTAAVSRVLLLTDVESRTPVLVDRTNARAILTGDGGRFPKLEYLRGADPVKTGDLVLSSGDGGVFPRGLPVGVAVKDLKGSWRVRLFSDSGPIDFVRVLLFQDFSDAVDPAALSKPAMPPLTAAEKAEIAATLQRAAQGAAAQPAAPKVAAPAPTAVKATSTPAPAPAAAPTGQARPALRAAASSVLATKPTAATNATPAVKPATPAARTAETTTTDSAKVAKPKPKPAHKAKPKAAPASSASGADASTPAPPPPVPDGPPDQVMLR